MHFSVLKRKALNGNEVIKRGRQTGRKYVRRPGIFEMRRILGCAHIASILDHTADIRSTA